MGLESSWRPRSEEGVRCDSNDGVIGEMREAGRVGEGGDAEECGEVVVSGVREEKTNMLDPDL